MRVRRGTARRALLAGGAALALFVPVAVVPPEALAGTGSATLTASEARITFGENVTLSGAVQADADCLAGRTVSLEASIADGTGWTTVDHVTSAADGSFSFSEYPPFNADYRAVLPEALIGPTVCDPITSAAVTVEVAARVEAEPAAGRVAAGGCTDVTLSVRPAKAGQTVRIARKAAGGWTTLSTETLDAASRAAAHLCFGWSDRGTVRLRATWPAQDPLNAAGATPVMSLEVVLAPWMERIEGLVAGRPISVSVGEDGGFLYRHADTVPRAPASNQKLLLSMALLDELGPDFRIVTRAAARTVRGGVVRGNLWIVGRGDPTIDGGRLGALAKRIAEAGVGKVEGSVMGDVGYFRHDWWAPGWRWYFPRDFVALPSALTFDGNSAGGVHIRDPELRAAEALTRRLRSRGVRVVGRPGAGHPRARLTDVATVTSSPLPVLLARQNRSSLNFSAEVLCKLLGARGSGAPGTIAKGAAAVAAWAGSHGVDVTAYDCSGLSYRDRVTAEGIVRLLWAADQAPWGTTLRNTLPRPNQGTLEDRLAGVRVRAKTGTLTDISALSGWVWLRKEGVWAEFSILSRAMSKSVAAGIEDAIVRTLSRSAKDASLAPRRRASRTPGPGD